ncbi:MAG: HAD family phosphatase [Acidimicrobiales bacterium]|nr:HAD family phosphatase [Acidimicrobiales bacterium]
MDLRMIVSDLDGTLLNDRTVVSERTMSVLRDAAAQGVIIVAATGRSIHSALDLLRPVGVVSWALCSNGATRFHLAEERLDHHRLIPSFEVDSFLTRVRAEYEEVGVAWETQTALRWDRLYQTHRDRLVPRPKRQEGHIAEFPAGSDLVKLLVTHPDTTHDEWLHALTPLVGDSMVASTSGTDFVEITHSSATKGQALADLCRELGIEAESVAAFGDQTNDIDMLEWAGWSYAMENAHPRVKRTAAQEAPHHAEDGVAQVISALLNG